jgi:DnaJ-class molecular chaperone
MDYYQLLGVTKMATPLEIRTAYRHRALLTHPDRIHHPDKQRERKLRQQSEQKFKEISEAYQVLRDPTSRRKYDITNKPTHVTSENHLETFYQMFPILRNQEVRQKLIEKLNDTLHSSLDPKWGQLLTSMLAKHYERHLHRQTTDTDYLSFDITVPITLEDHNLRNFHQDVSVTVNESINLTTTVDTREERSNYQQSITNSTGVTHVTLNMTCEYEPDPTFTPLVGKGDISHVITISSVDFMSGFKYTIPYFKQELTVCFQTPYLHNLSYVVEGYGLPYTDNSTGNLYLELVIDPIPLRNLHPTLPCSECDWLQPTPLTFVMLGERSS